MGKTVKLSFEGKKNLKMDLRLVILKKNWTPTPGQLYIYCYNIPNYIYIAIIKNQTKVNIHVSRVSVYRTIGFQERHEY